MAGTGPAMKCAMSVRPPRLFERLVVAAAELVGEDRAEGVNGRLIRLRGDEGVE